MGDVPPSPWCPDGHFDQGEGAAEAFDSDLGLVHVVNPVRRDILPEWLPSYTATQLWAELSALPVSLSPSRA
jgi:hypothetical protein